MIWFMATFLVFLASLLIYVFAAGPKLPSETGAIIERVLNSELPEVVRGKTGFAGHLSMPDIKWFVTITGERECPIGLRIGTVRIPIRW